MIIQRDREIKTISPTSLSAWLRCRSDWYNRYLLKTDRDGTWNMMAGNAIHLGTYLYHSNTGDWKEGLRNFYEEHSKILSHPDAPSLETFETLMRIYIMKNKRHPGDTAESYFKINIEGLEQPITGIFDLLPGEGHGIVEFKTGGWWTQSRVDLAMQTMHYSLAYREMFNRMPEYFHYYAFDFENIRVKLIKTLVEESELEDFIQFMKDAVDEMKNSVIIPKCLLKDNNQQCWYSEQCSAILDEVRESSIKITRGNCE